MGRVSVEMDESFAFCEFESWYKLIIGTLRSPRRRRVAEAGLFVFGGDRLFWVYRVDSKDEHRLSL